jgi:hypothetical protein
MTAKTEPPTIPAALADVALIDGPTAAAAFGESLSTFHDGVRRTARGELVAGEMPYPQPVVRRPRFSRFRLADVRARLIAMADQSTLDDAVIRQAKKASLKAREPAAVAKAQATRKARIAARAQAVQAGA